MLDNAGFTRETKINDFDFSGSLQELEVFMDSQHSDYKKIGYGDADFSLKVQELSDAFFSDLPEYLETYFQGDFFADAQNGIEGLALSSSDDISKKLRSQPSYISPNYAGRVRQNGDYLLTEADARDAADATEANPAWHQTIASLQVAIHEYAQRVREEIDRNYQVQSGSANLGIIDTFIMPEMETSRFLEDLAPSMLLGLNANSTDQDVHDAFRTSFRKQAFKEDSGQGITTCPFFSSLKNAIGRSFHEEESGVSSSNLLHGIYQKISERNTHQAAEAAL